MGKRVIGVVLALLLMALSSVAAASEKAARPEDLWLAYPNVKKVQVFDGKVQYLIAYDPTSGDVVYGDINLVADYINGMSRIDMPSTMKTLNDFTSLPGKLRKELGKQVPAKKLDNQVSANNFDPGNGGGCVDGPYEQYRSLTKGKIEAAGMYYYSLTVFWTFTCDGKVTSYSGSPATQTICYTATKSTSSGRVSDSQAWVKGDYVFTYSCAGNIMQKSRWIHAYVYGNGNINWTYAAP